MYHYQLFCNYFKIKCHFPCESGFFVVCLHLTITHTMKTQSSERIKAHTDFLEALGIIQAWQEKSDKENPQLTRLAELILAMLGRHQDLMLEVSDLGIMNSLIRNKKNEEIQKLKGM